MTRSIKVAIVALAVVAVGAATANAAFNTNLTVGSTGADVSALQSWLISKGFAIPSISSGAAKAGYFGSQTKTAVVAYQTSVGLPATGFVGPLTRGILNGSSVPTGTVAVCPVGYTCTANPGTVVAPAPVTSGGDGSITVSYSPYVTTSQTLKKGDIKDIYAVRLQATSGPVKVNRFDVHFSERPWLDFGQLTLKDSSGAVLATKALMSASDATEITVGTDYLVRFDNVNYSVNPGTDATLVVGASVLAASDKITGQTVTVSVPSGSIRTINGLGYTDSLGISNTNSLTLSSTGSAGDLFTRVSPNTQKQRAVTTSTTQTTPNVELGIFSVKLQNQAGVINSLSINLNNSTGVSTSTLFSNVRLIDATTGNTYGATSLVAAATTFTNLTIALKQDEWRDLKVVADVNSNQTNISASTTLVKASIVGVDSNYNTITLTNASNATANDVSFNTSSITVTNPASSYTLTTGGANGNTTGAAVTFTFTVMNTGNSDIFLSKVPSAALATSTSGSVGSPATGSSTLTYVLASPDTYASDTGTAPTSGAYVVPAGLSRTFTYSGTLDNTNGTAGLRVFKITQINYGTSAAAPTGQNVNYGLNNLVVTPSLANN